MKKIMLIIISVVMLFSSCEKQTENITDTTAEISVDAPKTQIDPAEEFGGITFGMTKDEVVNFLGKKPDFTYESNDEYTAYNYMEYWNEEQLNISNADVQYRYDKDYALHCVKFFYNYDESAQEQFMNDYEVIKEEILKRYPEETWIYSYNYKTVLTIYTENRRIFLNDSIDVSRISVMIEEYEDVEYDQIDPIEEFDGITFGMTQEEVIEFHGKQPDENFGDGFITYKDENYFNVSSDSTYVYYHFEDNGKLDSIMIMYIYYRDSKEKSFQADYNSVRGELLRRYPKIIQYVDDTNNDLWYFTDNRSINLSNDTNGVINISIDDMEKYNNTDT